MSSSSLIRSTGFRQRLALWALAWAALALTAFGDLWHRIGSQLSDPQQDNVFYGVMLLLCLLWLYLKRHDLISRMRSSRISTPYLALGLGMAIASLLLPGDGSMALLRLLLGGLGLFIALFAEAAILPVMALLVLGLTLLIPRAIKTFVVDQFSLAPVLVLVPLLSAFGLPIAHQGQTVNLLDTSGHPVSGYINVGCSGHYALGIMAGLFVLMMLEAPLPPRKAAIMLIVGLAGAWLQNLLRLIIIFLGGHFWGQSAISSLDSFLGYITFTVWLALFAYIYLRVASKKDKGGYYHESQTQPEAR